jgi:hypothetical protein
MHAEYATAWLPGEDSPPPVEPVAVELVVDVLGACEERLATPPLGDVPPHPATSTPAAISAVARQAATRRLTAVPSR